MLGAMYLKNSYENLYRSNVLIFWLLAMGVTGVGVVWKWKVLLKRMGGKRMKLCVENVSKRFGSKLAVDHVDAELSEGVYGFLGANGAGKRH